MMPNILQYPVALFGALRAGATVVNVNPLYTARELEHQLKDSGAEVIVVVENFAHTLQEVLPNTALRQVVVTSIGEMLGLKGLLVDLVLRDVEGQAGALPVLSHALAETWAHRDDRVLTVAGYRAGGGVQGAVAATADGVLDRLSPEGRRISRSLKRWPRGSPSAPTRSWPVS